MQVIMNDEAFLKKGFFISTDKDLLDVVMIHTYLSVESYWAQKMPLDTLKRSIENSLCFGIYHQKKQVGFAQVTTDKATFAYIGNVFVSDEFRGLGLSKWLMQVMLAHPELQNLRRWCLGTADAHGLYEQFGFKQIGSPERWMEIYSPGIYKEMDEKGIS